MSYTRTSSGYVHYSGSKYYSGSVHYPASQSGGYVNYDGTVHYEGDVQVVINVHVDTDPFDRSILHCNGSIGSLGTSVVALNAAQCKEIQDSSDKVSRSIIGGFFNLIKSEISQALASLISKINSGILLIKTHASRIREQQTLMDQDYHRLKAHYVGIFNDLDKECQRRVVALDRSAFNLGINVLKKQYVLPYLEHIGKNYTHLFDEPITQNKITNARLKGETVNIINGLHNNIIQEQVYKDNLASVLREENIDEAKSFFVPVLHAEFDDVEGTGEKKENYFSPLSASKDVIFNTVNNHFSSEKIEWNTIEKSEMDSINLSFNALLESVEDERVIEMIKKLKDASDIKVN